MLNIYCLGTCEYGLLCFDQNVLENCKNSKKKSNLHEKIVALLENNSYLGQKLESQFVIHISCFSDMAYN